MGGKGSAPAPPDYSALAQSSADAAKIQAQTSKDQLDWAKQQYADQAPQTKAFMQSMVDQQKQDQGIAAQNQTNAQQAQDFYKGTFQPIEKQFAGQATGYNDPARAAERSAAAQADVAHAFQGQRDAALQNLEGFGIDPSQTRYGALDLGTRISQAAATAGAATTSRQQSEATGLALEGEAINIGRGYPGQIAQSYGTALNAGQGNTASGSSGVSAGLNTSSTYGNMMGSPTQWAGLANQSTGLSGNILNSGFQNQMAGFNANTAIAQNQASGVGSLIGAGIGVAAIAV
jgi:hypothetical protein